jgi:hypothetical protein
MLKFKIEQLAIYAPTEDQQGAAMALLAGLGASFSVSDIVTARGESRISKDNPLESCTNVAELDFDYELAPNLEFEVLRYVEGRNWLINKNHACVSHIGTHVNEDELLMWKGRMAELNIPVLQEVETLSHSSPGVPKGRSYKYVIFGARAVLGFDLKFIVRQEACDGNVS